MFVFYIYIVLFIIIISFKEAWMLIAHFIELVSSIHLIHFYYTQGFYLGHNFFTKIV